MRKVFNDSMRSRCGGDLQNKVWVEALYVQDMISLQTQVYHRRVKESKNFK